MRIWRTMTKSVARRGLRLVESADPFDTCALRYDDWRRDDRELYTARNNG